MFQKRWIALAGITLISTLVIAQTREARLAEALEKISGGGHEQRRGFDGQRSHGLSRQKCGPENSSPRPLILPPTPICATAPMKGMLWIFGWPLPINRPRC